MEKLYKATAEGNVPMTDEEEAQIRAEWAESKKEAERPKPKTLEERVAALEAVILKGK